jgi:putative colanic acid biosynthesis acetyltransferase WcaF
MVVEKKSFTSPSFSLKNRLARAVWEVVYLFLFRPSPRPLFAWRVFLLRLFGAKIGKGVKIRPSVKIWAPWNLEIEDEVVIGDEVDLYSQGKIFLGYRAMISQRCFICTGSHDYSNANYQLFTKPIAIHKYVWVASEVFVAPGVTIGAYAVVGARSVVLKNVDEWSVVAGHPLKFIKKREFND